MLLRAWLPYRTETLLPVASPQKIGFEHLAGVNGGSASQHAEDRREPRWSSNFIWNQELTFRLSPARKPVAVPESYEARPSPFRSLVRYQKACLAGAGLNALTTLSSLAHGTAPMAAATAGVLAGGVWNLIFNVPRILQAWAASAPVSPKGAEAARLEPSGAGTADKKV